MADRSFKLDPLLDKLTIVVFLDLADVSKKALTVKDAVSTIDGDPPFPTVNVINV